MVLDICRCRHGAGPRRRIDLPAHRHGGRHRLVHTHRPDRLKRTIQGGIILLTACFASGYVLTTTFSSINAIMFVVFALVGLAWAAINVNSLPMVVEMCKGSDIGKFTGYYYTASMAAQVVTPIVAGTLMRKIDYRVLFPYAALFVALSFVTMLFVHHGDAKAEAKKGLEAFEEMDD